MRLAIDAGGAPPRSFSTDPRNLVLTSRVHQSKVNPMPFRPLHIACALVICTAVSLTADRFDRGNGSQDHPQGQHSADYTPLTIQTPHGGLTLTVI
jgi:hypothetical protein